MQRLFDEGRSVEAKQLQVYSNPISSATIARYSLVFFEQTNTMQNIHESANLAMAGRRWQTWHVCLTVQKHGMFVHKHDMFVQWYTTMACLFNGTQTWHVCYRYTKMSCAAKAFYSCPAIISRRPESRETPKEPQLNPEEESRIIQARSHVSSEKSSKNYKPSEE